MRYLRPQNDLKGIIMQELLNFSKTFISEHIKEDSVVADFTMGNGHDTAFLSKTVGKSGHVYAFDIQQQAIDSTAQLLKAEGCPDNVTLIHASHHLLKDYVKQPYRAGMFNLGYLPGSGKTGIDISLGCLSTHFLRS